MAPFSTIAIVREIESPENPGGLEKRASVIPDDVAKLVSAGAKVIVEAMAGNGVGFSDEEYLAAGAEIQSPGEIYQNKDLISGLEQLAPGVARALVCGPFDV